MPKKLPLTLAVGDYEIVRPLIDGEVEVDGVDLTVLSKMDSATRHWRFLRNGGQAEQREQDRPEEREHQHRQAPRDRRHRFALDVQHPDQGGDGEGERRSVECSGG